MSNLINLGSFNTNSSTGTTSAPGLVSGLDSTSLINGILQAQTTQVTADQASITANGTKITALGQLQTLLSTVESTLNLLRSPVGVNNASADLFQYTTSSLSSNTSTPASTYLSVTSQAGASINSYNIQNIVTAQANLIRKDGFTSATTSVVGNAITTDNYSTTGAVVGTVLNATTPVTFANDTNPDNTATAATIELNFGSQNQFDAADSVTFGSTTLTFGGTGGSDLDLSGAPTLDDKISDIVNYMNTVATGPESGYTYSSPSSGVILATRKVDGPIASVGGDMNVAADFSQGSDTTQEVGIGKNYANNGSADGSVPLSNAAISGSVSGNGVDGIAASSQASTTVQFGDNEFDDGDTLTFGNTTITFATSGGDVGDTLDISGDATLADKLSHIANFMNSQTTGPESGYSYTTNGTDSIIVTRDAIGDNATVGTDLALAADFSAGGNSQTIAFGNQIAANVPTPTILNASAPDGVDTTPIADSQTAAISTLSGGITIGAATFTAGSQSADTFSPNYVTFTATVGGQTYTSKPVYLDGGSITGGGVGTNGAGNSIPSGTVITFVKDVQTDATPGVKDVTFQLTTGDAATINNQGDATTYAISVGAALAPVSITQNTPPFTAGTFSLGGASVTLNVGDNLDVVASKINAVSGQSGITANVLQISANSYSLTLQSNNTGIANKIGEYGDGDPGDPPTGTIQIGGSNVAFTQQQAAGDASFALDGVTITRPSNNISDVIPNVTFSLLANTGVDNPTLTFSVQHDTSTVTTGINNFVTAYNNLKMFYAQQTQRDSSNNLVSAAVLGDDPNLQEVMTTVQQQLNSVVQGLSAGSPSSPFSVGLDTTSYPGDSTTPETDDILVLDPSTLAADLQSNFEGVRNTFALNFTSSSSDVSLYQSSNTSTLPNFKLDIDANRPVGDQVRVLDATTGAFICNMDASSTGLLTGQQGTPLAGLQLIYTGDAPETVNITVTQGIADKLYNTLNSYLTPTTGLVAVATQVYTDQDTTLQNKIDQENTDIAAQRQLLVNQFTQLETIVEQANSTLTFLDTQTATNNAPNN